LSTTTTTTTTTTSTTSTTTTTVPWYYASSYILTIGNLDSGTLNDTRSDDGTPMVFEEVTGNPGFDFQFYFEGLPVVMTSWDIHLNGYYQGNPAHLVKIQKWNFTLSQWDDFTADSGDFPSRATEDDYTFSIDGDEYSNYVSSQQFRIRIYHNWSGTPTHHFHVDYLWLENTVLPASDPEIIFKYQDQNRVFKHDTINKVFKHDEIQKVFKYEIKTTSKS